MRDESFGISKFDPWTTVPTERGCDEFSCIRSISRDRIRKVK